MNEADRVFEFAERRFNAPAPGVELPQRRKRELCGVQVGHQHLRFAVFPLQTYNSRRKRIEISAFRAKKVKWYAVWEPVIVLRDRDAVLPELLRRQSSQRHAHRQVALRAVGQFYAISIFSVAIPDADQILPAVLFQTGKVVVRLIIAIRQHDHGVADRGTCCHLAQRPGFVLGVLFLYDHIRINSVFEVKKRVDMERIPSVLVLCSGAIGILIRRIRPGFQR